MEYSGHRKWRKLLIDFFLNNALKCLISTINFLKFKFFLNKSLMHAMQWHWQGIKIILLYDSSVVFLCDELIYSSCRADLWALALFATKLATIIFLSFKKASCFLFQLYNLTISHQNNEYSSKQLVCEVYLKELHLISWFVWLFLNPK